MRQRTGGQNRSSDSRTHGVDMQQLRGGAECAYNVSVYPGTYIATSLKKSPRSESYVSLVTSDLSGSYLTQLELVHVFCGTYTNACDFIVKSCSLLSSKYKCKKT